MFPFRNHLVPRIFVNLVIKLCGTSYLKRLDHAGRSALPDMLQIEEDIFEMAKNKPTMFSRAIVAQVKVSHSNLWKTLRQEEYYQRVQALQLQQHLRRSLQMNPHIHEMG